MVFSGYHAHFFDWYSGESQYIASEALKPEMREPGQPKTNATVKDTICIVQELEQEKLIDTFYLRDTYLMENYTYEYEGQSF